MIKKKANDPKIVIDFADRIKNASNNVLTCLNNLLDLSQIENANFKLEIKEIDILEVLKQVKRNFELLALQKKQTVTITNNCNTIVLADAKRIQEAFENLMSNDLNYAHINSEIKVNVSAIENNLIVEFKDQGQGLTEEDMNKLFVKFAKLSAIPTGKEHSNGSGLSIVKMLIELHSGKVWAESKGKNKGASFFISLPIN